MARRKLVLDVDTGTDDAVAIMLAAQHPGLELLALTTVKGNYEVVDTTRNTLRVIDHISRPDIPVYRGSARPILRPDSPVPLAVRPRNGTNVRELPLPDPTSREQDIGAVRFLIETFRRDDHEEITLVAVGPLTNVAAAVLAEPDFARRVPELVIMGGGHDVSNITPAAELNIWADPEAAEIVFAAGFSRLTVLPLDATHQAVVSRADIADLKAIGTPSATASAALIEQRIDGHDKNHPLAEKGTAPVHDAVCVAYLVDPSIIATRPLFVTVETRGEHTVGRTVMDINHRSGKGPNCDVATSCDRVKFMDMLKDVFAQSRTSADA